MKLEERIQLFLSLVSGNHRSEAERELRYLLSIGSVNRMVAMRRALSRLSRISDVGAPCWCRLPINARVQCEGQDRCVQALAAIRMFDLEGEDVPVRSRT